MVHHSACPLCQSEKVSGLFSCKDHFISHEEFGISGCADCGFVFTQDYPEEKDISGYYESDDYISHSNTSKGIINKLYLLARSIMLGRKKAEVIRSTRLKKGSILDIGSGTGYFAGTMKSAGWQVKGVEINDKAREYSVSQFGIDVLDPAAILTLKSESFDCITLWHVLEHFHNPFAYAAEIKRLLKPSGICIIALPNSGSYDAHYYGKYWAAYDIPRHLWHFNPNTFRIFAEKSGFKVDKIRSLPLDVFYISSLSEKYKGTKLSFITGIIRASLFALQAVFNRERSSSVIYFVSKKN